MATITIKVDSEQLAREVLTQLGYLPDDVPDLISEDDEAEEPVEETCPDPKDEGFGTHLDQTGAIDLGDLKDGSLEKAVAMGQKRKDQEMKDLGEAITRGLTMTNKDLFEFLQSKGQTLKEVCDKEPEVGDFFTKFMTAPAKRIEGELEQSNLSKDVGAEIDQEPDDSIKKLCLEQVSKEREVLEKLRGDIRAGAMAIPDDQERFEFLISRADDETRRMIRDAAKDLVFEFIANRNLDPAFVSKLNKTLFDKVNQHRFFVNCYGKEGGL